MIYVLLFYKITKGHYSVKMLVELRCSISAHPLNDALYLYQNAQISQRVSEFLSRQDLQTEIYKGS